jgi:hypothetical protein
LSKAELPALFEVLSDPSKTFEQCLQQFLKFSKAEQFRACCTLCYLLENNVSILINISNSL